MPHVPTLVLVVRPWNPFRALGSTVMRGLQLADMVRPFLEGRLNVRVLPFRPDIAPARALAALIPRGAVVVFVKFAGDGWTPDRLAPVRRRAATVGLDVVDLPLSEAPLDLFDFYISASMSGRRALQDALAARGRGATPVALLHHHADPRLDGAEPPADRGFGCLYLGARENTIIPPALGDDVDVLEVRNAQDFAANLGRIGAYSLHFAVRAPAEPDEGAERSYKPFTKGMTAAKCRANVLVNRDADDVEDLLGADYPFLTAGCADEDIAATFELARSAFGGGVWRDALAKVQDIDGLVTPAALAAQLERIVIEQLDRATSSAG